jgi:hypothetical protein
MSLINSDMSSVTKNFQEATAALFHIKTLKKLVPSQRTLKFSQTIIYQAEPVPFSSDLEN